MASAIPPRGAQAAQAGDGFDRDRRLAAHARDRQAVQRGLFDRRAEPKPKRMGGRQRRLEQRHGRQSPTGGAGAAALPDVMIEGVSGSLSPTTARAPARRRLPAAWVSDPGSRPAPHPCLVAPRWLGKAPSSLQAVLTWSRAARERARFARQPREACRVLLLGDAVSNPRFR
jgi:hypothetical protein